MLDSFSPFSSLVFFTTPCSTQSKQISTRILYSLHEMSRSLVESKFWTFVLLAKDNPKGVFGGIERS
jgi:hypothetical protein